MNNPQIKAIAVYGQPTRQQGRLQRRPTPAILLKPADQSDERLAAFRKLQRLHTIRFAVARILQVIEL